MKNWIIAAVLCGSLGIASQAEAIIFGGRVARNLAQARLNRAAARALDRSSFGFNGVNVQVPFTSVNVGGFSNGYSNFSSRVNLIPQFQQRVEFVPQFQSSFQSFSIPSVVTERIEIQTFDSGGCFGW